MFDVDDGIGRYGDSLSCHLNLKMTTLLDAVSKASQLSDKLFRGIVLLNVATAPFPLSCHLCTSVCLRISNAA